MRKLDPYSLAALGFGVVAIAALVLLAGDAAPTAEVVDVRKEAATARYNRGNVAGTLKRAKTRDPRDIRGIMLHQVGVADVGDGAWRKMSYHWGVTKDGRVYRIHPAEIELFHGHGLNHTTVAISVEGNYGDGDEMPAAQSSALKAAISMARAEILQKGGEVESIFAHRQTSGDRGRDPAEDPWQDGALWAAATYGIKIHQDFTHGSGSPIPDRWMEPDTGFA